MNCLNHVQPTKSSNEKQIIVCQTVWAIFSEQTFAQLRMGFRLLKQESISTANYLYSNHTKPANGGKNCTFSLFSGWLVCLLGVPFNWHWLSLLFATWTIKHWLSLPFATWTIKHWLSLLFTTWTIYHQGLGKDYYFKILTKWKWFINRACPRMGPHALPGLVGVVLVHSKVVWNRWRHTDICHNTWT